MSNKDRRRAAYTRSLIKKALDLIAMHPSELDQHVRHVKRHWGRYAYVSEHTTEGDRWQRALQSWRQYRYVVDGQFYGVWGQDPDPKAYRQPYRAIRVLADDDPLLPTVWKAWQREYLKELLSDLPDDRDVDQLIDLLMDPSVDWVT